MVSALKSLNKPLQLKTSFSGFSRGAKTNGSEPSRSASDTLVGIEIDGRVVRAVTLKSNRVQSYQEYVGTSVKDALLRWRADTKPKGAVSATWSGRAFIAKTRVRDMAPEAMPAVIADKASEIFALHDPSGEIFAAAILGVASEGEMERPAIIAAMNPGVVRDIYDALAGLTLTLTVSAFVEAQDGLHLHIRSDRVWMSLIRNSVPVEVRDFNTPGIDSLTLSATGPSDPTEAVQVEGYVRRLVEEAFTTATHWSGNNPRFPEDLIVDGPGASLPKLFRAFEDRSGVGVILKPHLATPNPSLDVSVIPAQAGASAITALNAATAKLQTFASFSTPKVASAEAVKRDRSKRLARLGIASGAAVGLVILTSVPWIVAKRHEASAHARLNQANLTLASLAKDYAIYQQEQALTSAVNGIKNTETDWAAVFAAIYGSLPPQTQITNLVVNASAASLATVTASITATGAPFSPAAQLVAALEKVGATNVVLAGLSASGDQLTFSLSFSIPERTVAKK